MSISHLTQIFLLFLERARCSSPQIDFKGRSEAFVHFLPLLSCACPLGIAVRRGERKKNMKSFIYFFDCSMVGWFSLSLFFSCWLQVFSSYINNCIQVVGRLLSLFIAIPCLALCLNPWTGGGPSKFCAQGNRF